MEKEIRALEQLHRCVRLSIEKAKSSDHIPEGVLDTLENISITLKKIRTLARNRRKRKIGIFGAPKRGKSTLVNVFLGGDILPNGTTPTTRCAVELHNIAGSGEKQRIIVHEECGYDSFEHDVQSMDEIKDTLWRCFSRNSTATKIEVFGDFSSGSIMENCILVDTPGAEMAFIDESHESEMGERGASLQLETNRAIEMLKEVDVVLFCMRADQIGNRSEFDFYKSTLYRLKPLNIVNFKDRCPSDEEEDVLEEIVRTYGMMRRETVMVSALDGLDALLGSTFSTQEEKERLLEPSGMTELRKAMEERIKAMEPLEGFRRAVFEYEHILFRNTALAPPNAFIESLIACARTLQGGEEMVAKVKSIL